MASPVYRVATRSWIFLDSRSVWGDQRTISGGSFGMVVRDLVPDEGDEHDLLLLTAAHVCGSLSVAGPGSHRVLFHATGASQALGHSLGIVRRSVPVDPGIDEIPVDATLIKPWRNVELVPRIGRGQPPRGIRDLSQDPPDDFVAVVKDGARTGRTTGLLEPISADEYTVTRHYVSGWWVEGDSGPFALVGDSGSIICDDEDNAVGMAVAISQPLRGHPRTFCHAIAPVMSALNVTLP